MGYLKIHLPVSIIVTLTFAHPVATKAAVKLLACRRVAGEYFLDADFNIRCDSDEYMVWATTVAIPLLILFTFGMPLAYAAAMYRHVKNGTLMLERQVYGFFFSGFRAEIWWFELWNTLRKSLFTISAVLFAPLGVMMQTWAALVLLLTFLVVFSVSQPYEQSYLNDLERSALSISVITLLSGLGLFTNDQADEDAKTETFANMLTFTVIFTNAMFIVNVIRIFVQHNQYLTICHRFKKKIEKKTKTFPTTTVVPDQHIYAALKMRNNVNIAIQRELDKATKKNKTNKTKKTGLSKRSSRLFSKSTLDRVVSVNISNHVIKHATSAAALYKEKVIVRKNVASQRLRTRLSKRKIKVVQLLKQKPVVPIQQIQETQQKQQTQKQLNIRQILMLRRKIKKIKSSRVGTCITASKKVHVTKAEQPGDWSEKLDQTSGHPYWYNNKTGISSWENPKNVVLVKQQQQIRSSDYVALQSAVASKVANIPVGKIFHKLDRKKKGKIQYKQFKNLLKLVSDKKLSNNIMEEAWSYASNGTNDMDQNELKVWIDLCIESTGEKRNYAAVKQKVVKVQKAVVEEKKAVVEEDKEIQFDEWCEVYDPASGCNYYQHLLDETITQWELPNGFNPVAARKRVKLLMLCGSISELPHGLALLVATRKIQSIYRAKLARNIMRGKRAEKMSMSRPSATAVDGKPAKWMKMHDHHSGYDYYYNNEDGSTSWDVPHDYHQVY